MAKYGLIGALNSAITLITIIIFTYAGFGPYVCNAVGFACGLLNSFFMNGRFTFETSSGRGGVIKFSIAFAIAYSINLFVLYYAIRFSSAGVVISQVISTLFYNVTFFILMKFWVFKNYE
ncbi:GtrA family protein [Phyllobacterium sp. TAF24]|uniref:GtrA family protein n=1 Tax=Phyllobacterium sp. TAF24 TaxID=3233068 RepID=UPI003F951FCA